MVDVGDVAVVLCLVNVAGHGIGTALLHQVAYSAVGVVFINEIGLAVLMLVVNGEHTFLHVGMKRIQVGLPLLLLSFGQSRSVPFAKQDFCFVQMKLYQLLFAQRLRRCIFQRRIYIFLVEPLFVYGHQLVKGSPHILRSNKS